MAGLRVESSREDGKWEEIVLHCTHAAL